MYVSWNDHTVHLSVDVVKDVVCENCKTEFCYGMQLTEMGMGTSLYGLDEVGAQNRAAENARVKLQNSLNESFDPVPCPNCGIYQAHMVEFLKKSHLKWLVLVAWVFIIIAVVSMGLEFLRLKTGLAGFAVVAFLIGVGLIVGRAISVNFYDPNSGDPEPRKQQARRVAMLKQQDTRRARE